MLYFRIFQLVYAVLCDSGSYFLKYLIKLLSYNECLHILSHSLTHILHYESVGHSKRVRLSELDLVFFSPCIGNRMYVIASGSIIPHLCCLQEMYQRDYKGVIQTATNCVTYIRRHTRRHTRCLILGRGRLWWEINSKVFLQEKYLFIFNV